MSEIDEVEKWQEIANRYLAAVESLLTTVAEYKSLVSEYERTTAIGTAELEALRQERDGLLADAERYRWLRSKNVGPSQIEKVSDDCNPPYFTLKCEGELDAAIDAAMAKEQGDES